MISTFFHHTYGKLLVHYKKSFRKLNRFLVKLSWSQSLGTTPITSHYTAGMGFKRTIYLVPASTTELAWHVTPYLREMWNLGWLPSICGIHICQTLTFLALYVCILQLLSSAYYWIRLIFSYVLKSWFQSHVASWNLKVVTLFFGIQFWSHFTSWKWKLATWLLETQNSLYVALFSFFSGICPLLRPTSHAWQHVILDPIYNTNLLWTPRMKIMHSINGLWFIFFNKIYYLH